MSSGESTEALADPRYEYPLATASGSAPWVWALGDGFNVWVMRFRQLSLPRALLALVFIHGPVCAGHQLFDGKILFRIKICDADADGEIVGPINPRVVGGKLRMQTRGKRLDTFFRAD